MPYMPFPTSYIAKAMQEAQNPTLSAPGTEWRLSLVWIYSTTMLLGREGKWWRIQIVPTCTGPIFSYRYIKREHMYQATWSDGRWTITSNVIIQVTFETSAVASVEASTMTRTFEKSCPKLCLKFYHSRNHRAYKITKEANINYTWDSLPHVLYLVSVC